MQGKEAIKIALVSTQHLVPMYLGDLSDADILVRPAPSANHIAWQMGHLIHAEVSLLKSQLPSAVYPELPAGYGEQHHGKNAGSDTGFGTKADYLSTFTKVREATIANLAKLADADLDKPTTGNMKDFAPNLGAFFILLANHTLMHAGQFTVLRRKLGKPVVF